MVVAVATPSSDGALSSVVCISDPSAALGAQSLLTQPSLCLPSGADLLTPLPAAVSSVTVLVCSYLLRVESS